MTIKRVVLMLKNENFWEILNPSIHITNIFCSEHVVRPHPNEVSIHLESTITTNIENIYMRRTARIFESWNFRL